jgi:hypothetical protein
VNDPEKPTPETIRAAERREPLPAPLITVPRLGTVPPVQRGEDWVRAATPQQIDDAFKAGELHQYAGGKLDVQGWPADSRGRRIDLGAGR